MVSDGVAFSPEEIARYRRRARVQLANAVYLYFITHANISTALIARRLGWTEQRARRVLSEPEKWTIDTASNLCSAMGCELVPGGVPIGGPDHG